MKKMKLILVAFSMIFATSLYAQNNEIVGFSFSGLNKNLLLRSGTNQHDYETFKGHGFISFSMDYWYPLTDWLSVETGINYSLQNFTKYYDNPTVTPPDVVETVSNMSFLNVPVGFRVNFLKYGFVNSGLLIDLSQNQGIGSYFGVGARIESAVGFGMYINPYVKIHSILPVDFDMGKDRVLEMGVKIGVSYTLNNLFRKQNL